VRLQFEYTLQSYVVFADKEYKLTDVPYVAEVAVIHVPEEAGLYWTVYANAPLTELQFRVAVLDAILDA
jgi:hypothetical protein